MPLKIDKIIGKFFPFQIFFTISLWCEAQPLSIKLRISVDSLVKSEMVQASAVVPT
jgi:hypothetical protein